MVIIKNEFKQKDVIAGVIPLKTFKNSFLAVTQKENIKNKNILKMKEEVLIHFEKELFELVNEIFDPLIPFQEMT